MGILFYHGSGFSYFKYFANGLFIFFNPLATHLALCRAIKTPILHPKQALKKCKRLFGFLKYV